MKFTPFFIVHRDGHWEAVDANGSRLSGRTFATKRELVNLVEEQMGGDLITPRTVLIPNKHKQFELL